MGNVEFIKRSALSGEKYDVFDKDVVHILNIFQAAYYVYSGCPILDVQLSKDRKTGIDIWISYIAFIFGLEFDCSLKLIKENNYINKLFDRFDYKEEIDRMNILRNKTNSYLNDKLNYEKN